MGMGLEVNQHYPTRQLPQRRPLEFPQTNEVLIPLDSAGEANSTRKEESSEFKGLLSPHSWLSSPPLPKKYHHFKSRHWKFNLHC